MNRELTWWQKILFRYMSFSTLSRFRWFRRYKGGTWLFVVKGFDNTVWVRHFVDPECQHQPVYMSSVVRMEKYPL